MWNCLILFFGVAFLHRICDVGALGETRKEIAKDVIKRVSFTEWRKWKIDFPNCDPEKNRHTSPINVAAATATRDNSLSPIVVHGGLPAEDCLYLSSIHKEEDMEMEVVTIFPEPACSKQITYISGAGEGNRDVRYFRRALLFFASSKISLPQSLHQFDGKSFDMEIAMEFSDTDGAAVTELHLMVEALPPSKAPDNPVLKSIEEALVKLRAKVEDEAVGVTKRSQIHKRLKIKCERAEQAYFDAFEKHEKEEQAGMKFNQRLHELDNIISGIKHIKDDDLKQLIKKVKEYNATVLREQIKSLEEELATLTEKQRELKELVANEDKEKEHELDDSLKKVNSDIRIRSLKIKKLKKAAKATGRRSPKNILENIRTVFKYNKVGIPGESGFEGMKFATPNAVYKEREEVLGKLNLLSEAEGAYDKACLGYATYAKTTRYAFVPIQGPFQLSWLFPVHGGYYYYKGSNPIPNCKRREHSIVFETPLRITTEQLKLFQDIPSILSTGTDGTGQIDNAIPVLHNSSVCEVWHALKDPVFLRDDGFHARHNKHLSDTKTGKMRARSDDFDEDSSSSCSGRENHFSYYIIHFVIYAVHICLAA